MVVMAGSIKQRLGVDAATPPFVIGSTPPTDSDLYLYLQPDGDEKPRLIRISASENPKELSKSDRSKLLYHVNGVMNIYRLCISPSVAPNIPTNVHDESNLRFPRYQEILIQFWFLCTLTKLLCFFICHY